MTNKESTTQFCDSAHSTKCHGAGNGRTQSLITSRLRRQVNKRRRHHLMKDLKLRLDY